MFGTQFSAPSVLEFYRLAILSFSRSNAFYFFVQLQEQTKLDTTKQVISPEDCDDLSPMPQSQVPPVRRRGGISAEPVTEEDATSYVKKVSRTSHAIGARTCHLRQRQYPILMFLYRAGRAERLQNYGRTLESHRKKCALLAFGRKRTIRHIRRNVSSELFARRRNYSARRRRRQFLCHRSWRSRGKNKHWTQRLRFRKSQYVYGYLTRFERTSRFL